MHSYIERHTGERYVPTCYLYGQSSTTLSVDAADIAPDDVLLHDAPGTTPAILWNGVYYRLDTIKD